MSKIGAGCQGNAADKRRQSNVPLALATPVGVDAPAIHRYRRKDVRNGRQQPHFKIGQATKALNDLRQPKRQAIESDDDAEIYNAKQPYA